MVFRALSYVAGVTLEIPIEFQLRTAAEDIWAEINHKLIYKTNTTFCWSDKFAEKFGSAKNKSDAVKDHIDKLSKEIQSMHIASTEASEAVAKLWDKGNHKYHFSTCISLLVTIGPSDYHRDSKLDLYLKKVHALRKSVNKEEVREALRLVDQSINIVEKLRSKLAAEHQKINAIKPGPSIEKSVLEEQIALLRLENLRLRTFTFLFLECAKLGSHFVSVGEKRHDGVDTSSSIASESEIASQLYSEFCEYLDSDYNVMPIVMIHYFKNLLAEYFDRDAQKRNLESCYTFLEQDKSLPIWSIYRVLIPRSSCKYYTSQFHTISNKVASKDSKIDILNLRNSNSVSQVMQDNILNALKYSMKALENHSAGGTDQELLSKRGDILFGFGEDEDYLDVGTILALCEDYRKWFADTELRLLPTELEMLKDVLRICVGKSGSYFRPLKRRQETVEFQERAAKIINWLNLDVEK